jgi:hypothetical protein
MIFCAALVRHWDGFCFMLRTPLWMALFALMSSAAFAAPLRGPLESDETPLPGVMMGGSQASTESVVRDSRTGLVPQQPSRVGRSAAPASEDSRVGAEQVRALPMQPAAEPSAERIDGRIEERVDVRQNPRVTGAVTDPNQVVRTQSIRRAERPLQEEDPYEQLGIRTGGLILFPSVEVGVGFDSNINRSSAAQTSGAVFEISPELRVQSNWTRHALSASLRGSLTQYSEGNTTTQPDFNGNIALALDAMRDLQITPDARFSIRPLERNDANLPLGITDIPLVYSYGAGLSLQKTFNRFDVLVSVGIDRSEYDNNGSGAGIGLGGGSGCGGSSSGSSCSGGSSGGSGCGSSSSGCSGVSASNADRNATTYSLRLRPSYELSPDTRVFVEGEIDTRQFDEDVDRNGLNRDSIGYAARIGAAFALTRLLTGEVSAGYALRTYDDALLGDLSGPTLDGSLTWLASSLTRLTLRASTQIEDTTLLGSSGTVARLIGLEASHQLRRYLIGTAGLTFSQADYNGTGRTDDVVTASLRADYKLSRTTALFGRYSWRHLSSSTAGIDYDAHMVMTGVRLQK